MIWRLEYENSHGDVARLDIQRGAATPIETIEGTENPFLLSYELEDKSKKGFIMSSFADISIYETATFNIDDLKTLDETALSVKWYINSVLEWTGFVVPDFFSRTIGEPAIVNLAASDRLSSLEDATLDGLGEYVKLKDLTIACLAKTGLSLPLISTVDFKADTTNIMDAFALSERLEDDKGKKISCFDVLRSILVLTNSTIRQRKGQWRIYNKIQHEAVAPTLNFNEVYQGAKRTIQPVFSSVGAFQEFGGTKGFPRNNTFSNSAAGWVAENGFITEFDNRELNYTSPYFAPTFGDETNKINLINRNIWIQGSFDTEKKLSSPPFKVPFRGADSVAFTLEINARGMPNQALRYELVKRVDGVPVSFMRNDGTWSPSFGGLISFFPPQEDEAPFYSVDAIATIKSDVYLEESEDPEKVTLTVHILGVNAYTPSVGEPVIFASAIRSAKVVFDEKNDNGKGILYRTDQLGSFSKKSDPNTTIFGDFISSGLNGYFYPYSEDEKSILRSPSGSNPPLSKWTTATDPAAGELPILQHVTRQMSRMFGVAHNVLSAVIDAKTFDPLAIVTNCAGEKYVIVYSVFDFLRSTVEVELQQIAYGSLQRRDFIFSYFGGGDGDGISSIGSVSGGGSSSSSGGGSFLDKYFSFDEANDALVANVNLVSEKEIAAYFADGTLPSFWDAIPPATSSKVGGIKAASTYQNGIRINASGFLEIDPSYADSGVSSWDDLANRPTWLTPTTKAAFEAGHGHTWGQITSKPTSFPPSSHNHPISDVTDLQTALNGKLATGAQAYDSARLGGELVSKYTRRDVAEEITGNWVFTGRVRATNTSPRYEFFQTDVENACRWVLDGNLLQMQKLNYATGGFEGSPMIIDINAPSNSIRVTPNGNVGFGIVPTERLHVAGNGLFTGNITAQKGTFSSLDVTGDIKLGTALNALIKYDAVNDVIRFNKTIVSDYDVVAYADSGQDLPSIFDNLPKASTTNFGLVKIGSGISVTGGVISVDGDQFNLSNYYTKVQSEGMFKPIGYQPTWAQVTGKPAVFPPSSHNHIIGDVTDLQTALNGKENSFTKNNAFNKTFGTGSENVPRGNDSRINNGQTAFGWGNHAIAGYIKSYVDTKYTAGNGISISGANVITNTYPNLSNVGNYSDYARKTQNETISSTWNFSRINTNGHLYMTAGSPRIEFHDTSTSQACRWVLSGGVMRLQTIGYGTSVYAKQAVNFSTLAPDSSMNLSDSGNLSVIGNITAQGEVTAYSSSDVRLKQNIKPIENALGIISKLNPVSFNWNIKAIELNSAKDGRVNYGVVAQELEEVMPELIHETNGYKSVDYPQLIMILAKAVQELNLKIEELKNK